MQRKVQRSRLTRALDALSQLLNVIIFNGDENYSISADAYCYDRKVIKLLANSLFMDKNHCRDAYLNDINKAKALLQEAQGGEL